jgi:hypothetical protein
LGCRDNNPPPDKPKVQKCRAGEGEANKKMQSSNVQLTTCLNSSYRAPTGTVAIRQFIEESRGLPLHLRNMSSGTSGECVDCIPENVDFRIESQLSTGRFHSVNNKSRRRCLDFCKPIAESDVESPRHFREISKPIEINQNGPVDDGEIAEEQNIGILRKRELSGCH